MTISGLAFFAALFLEGAGVQGGECSNPDEYPAVQEDGVTSSRLEIEP